MVNIGLGASVRIIEALHIDDEEVARWLSRVPLHGTKGIHAHMLNEDQIQRFVDHAYQVSRIIVNMAIWVLIPWLP